MQTQNENIVVCFAPDGTRCAYCLKLSGDEMMVPVRRANLKTGQRGETVYVCAEFAPCAARRHAIRMR